MKRNCLIIHGSPCKDTRKDKPYIPENERHWIPWIKNQLEERGIKTFNPLMPIPWNPKYRAWKKRIEKIVTDDIMIFIGHSAGCAFLVRWLGDTNRKAKKLILVAPGKVICEYNLRLEDLYDFDISKVIRTNVEEITIFIADDEDDDIRHSAVIYHRELGGKWIELKGKGHFVLEDMGTAEFPELLEVLE